jgi:hypothetical protein
MAKIVVGNNGTSTPGEAEFVVHFSNLKDGQQTKLTKFFGELANSLSDGRISTMEALVLGTTLQDALK